MPRKIILASSALLAALACVLLVQAELPPDRKPDGIGKRPAWTTSKVRGSPDPPSPYRVEVAFPKLKFDEPLDINTVAGSDRLFVTERFGRVYSFPNDPKVEKPDLLIDFNQVYGGTPKTVAAYGFAPHPQFAKNGYVFATVVPRADREEPKGTRVSRFKASGDPPTCDPKSELVLIEWPSGGHNGGCLMFGPDGYLYVATGDASGIGDSNLAGQDLTTLAGKILRIDVDNPAAGKNYDIPKDNPFVDHKGEWRREIFAYGLRQPWKMSFDRATGDFWCGNIGQDLWEQIYLIQKGGNYGWSVQEGSHPFRPERPRGPTPIIMPTVEHDHANFRSITGGFVYHGKRLADLTGSYIYGDYDTGRIWMFRYDRQKKTVSDHRELVDSSLRLIGFAQDSAGELHLLDHMSGQISRLVPNPVANTAGQFPRKLSETGLFASTKDHKPAAGVVPYSVVAPQWCDGATKERFIALPGNSQIEFEGMLYPFARGAPPGWKFPDGTVLAETLFLDTDGGKKRIETRILHHERLSGQEFVGDQYWQGYTYLWNDDQTDAVLLEDPQGRDRAYSVRDAKAPGGKRQYTWHFPSRTECTVCHNMAAKYAVGVQTMQMNRDHDYGGVVTNQLTAFDRMGMFTKPLLTPPQELPRLADYHDQSQPLDLRARSYLHANCSHCHRTWGGGNAEFELPATYPPHEMKLMDVRPGQGTFNIPNARLVAPREPFRSVLFYRMSTLGPARMPRLGSTVVDEVGVKLIHDWISQLPGTGLYTAGPAWKDGLTATAVADLNVMAKAKDDELNRRIDLLLSTPGTALRLAHGLGQTPPKIRDTVLARAAKSESPEVRDLFERFMPEEQRVKRLGSVVKPEQILALTGDVERGRKLFLEGSGVACRNCHRVGGKGTEVGPDLDGIGKKYDRGQILDNILNPSRQIEVKYLTHLLETKRGQAYSGLLVSRDEKLVVLKDANNKRIEVPAADVEVLVGQQKSLMPELLLRDLTAEQVADLTAFLQSLR